MAAGSRILCYARTLTTPTTTRTATTTTATATTTIADKPQTFFRAVAAAAATAHVVCCSRLKAWPFTWLAAGGARQHSQRAQRVEPTRMDAVWCHVVPVRSRIGHRAGVWLAADLQCATCCKCSANHSENRPRKCRIDSIRLFQLADNARGGREEEEGGNNFIALAGMILLCWKYHIG